MPPTRKIPSFILAVLVLAVPLSAAGGGADELLLISASSDSEPAGLSSLQKSLIIPGWGQAAEKRYLEAAIFFSAEVLCWAGFIDQNRKGNRSYDLYKAAAATDDAVRYRRETETFDKRRNLFLLGAALVWAANLLDTHRIVSGKHKAGEARSLSLRLESGEGQKISLALACRF